MFICPFTHIFLLTNKNTWVTHQLQFFLLSELLSVYFKKIKVPTAHPVLELGTQRNDFCLELYYRKSHTVRLCRSHGQQQLYGWWMSFRVATRRWRSGWTTTNTFWAPSPCACWSYRWVVSSCGAEQAEGLLQHTFTSTSSVCVSSAPRHGLLHDSLPADPQVRKEVRSLRTKAATLLLRGTRYITVSPLRTAYSVTFSLFFFIIVKPNQLLFFWSYNLFLNLTSIKTARRCLVASEVALLVVAFWNACFLL